jgi:SAM-dependent methyltransferase
MRPPLRGAAFNPKMPFSRMNIGNHKRSTYPPRRTVLRAILLGFCLLLRSLPSVLARGISSPVDSQVIDPEDRDFWNGKFSTPETKFNHQPSRLLVDAIRDRKPGTALDLGMGEGRNAIYLAQQGWQVTGVDLSDVAVSQANEHAASFGVRINTVIDGLDHYDFGQNRWDLIVLFYMHAWYSDARPRSSQRIYEALKPGGLLVVEGFAGSEGYLFHANELLRDFADLKILRYEDIEGEADWAPGKKSHIIRLIAEKPMPSAPR